MMICSDTGVRVGAGKGAALHLRAIAAAFAELGHEVVVIGVATSDPAELSGWPTAVNTVPHPGRATGLLRERRKLETTERVAELAHRIATTFGPDVIYERLSLFGTAGLRTAARTGALHVVEVNALLAAEESTWRGLHLVDAAKTAEAEVLQSADLVVSVSAEVARQVGASGRRARTIVIPNGVDTTLFAALPGRDESRTRLGLPPEAFLAGFTGSLRPWHGVEVAIRALSYTPEHVHLVVAGDGPIRHELESSAEAGDVSHRVHWLGQRPHAEIPVVLAACDVGVAPYPQLPSFGFSPLKLYEYLAAGLPVVASDVGEIAAVLGNGKWGTLVQPDDPIELADRLCDHLRDPQPAHARAQAGREMTLQHHGWESRARDILVGIDEVATRVGPESDQGGRRAVAR